MADDSDGPGTQLVVNVSGIDLGVGRVLERTLLPPAEQAMGLLRDVLGTFRLELSLKLLARARRKIEEAGLEHEPIGPVSLARILPLLENGSIETDESLQDRWSSLLANAVLDSAAVPPSFAGILRELSAREAALLDGLFTAVMASEDPPQLEARRCELAPFAAAVGLEGLLLEVAKHNLSRLGLCRGGGTFGGDVNLESVTLTYRGYAFVRACRAPAAEG